MHDPTPENVPVRRMTGSALLVHLRWSAVLDRMASQAARNRRLASSVVLLPESVMRQALARLALR